MSKLQELFGLFQNEISNETDIKYKISEVEIAFNADVAVIKSEYINLFSIQPIKLPYNIVGNGLLEISFSFNLRELSQVNHTNYDEIKVATDLRSDNIIDNLYLISFKYHHYVQQLNNIDCKPIFKDRLFHKINEECIYTLMINRYFKVISHIYQIKLKDRELDKILYPLISKSCEDSMGLVITPGEIQQLLSLEKLNYNDYLLSLLRLIEVIVEYTVDTIILISIASEGSSNEQQSMQYSVSLINLQIATKLQNGFLMLDLKNDNVRRKYDGLKYNLKKLNGIVYDLSLRKLILNEVEIY